MNNAREEILKLSTDRLRNKVESIMLEINLILSNPTGQDNQVGRISELLIEASVAELAMKHSQVLLNQCLDLRLKEIAATMKSQIEEPSQEEHNKDEEE